jgi:hypothetical protein
MPYIDPPRRKPIDKALESIEWTWMERGDLTYLLYRAALLFVERGRERTYASLSAALGCLNDAEAEFRRQELNPLEDRKRFDRGKVAP